LYMAEITMTVVTEIADPKLRAVAMRVVNTLRLAAEKVAANHADPQKFPLADESDSLEALFLSRFQQLRPEKQQVAAAKVMPLINASTEERAKIYGDLAKVDLRSVHGIRTQVKALPLPEALKFPLSHLQHLTTVQGHILPSNSPSKGFTPQQTTDHLQFRLRSLKCIDETNPEIGGSDEMHMAAVRIDALGNTSVMPDTELNIFDDDDHKAFDPPRLCADFDLRPGTNWPKSYFVTLVLAEVDHGGLSDFALKLFEETEKEVRKRIAEAILEGTAAGAPAGLYGMAIGAAVGFVVGVVSGWLKDIWEDDYFLPVTVSTQVPSLDARWAGKTESPEDWIHWTGHGGEYQLWYDWCMTGTGQQVSPDKDGKIFGLAPDGSGVYNYDGSPESWTQVGGPATAIYGGGGVLCATNPDTGDLYRYDGAPMAWTKIGGPGESFLADSDQAIYGVSPDKSEIYRYDGAPMAWTKIGGPGKKWVTAGNKLYGLAPDGSGVYVYDGTPESWTQVGGPATEIYGGGVLCATNPDTGDLYHYDGAPMAWTKIGGPGSAFLVE
jgi:hypothetical protein